MTEFSFTVYGVAVPKGSARAFMRPGARFPVVTHDNKKTKTWGKDVSKAAQAELARLGLGGDELIKGPILLRVTFFLPRPKSLPKRVTAHCKKPDLDKLVRAIKDSLSKVVWRDDSQVTQINAWKYYADGEASSRAVIHVVALEQQQLPLGERRTG